VKVPDRVQPGGMAREPLNVNIPAPANTSPPLAFEQASSAF
jgi:hypothetical protein